MEELKEFTPAYDDKTLLGLSISLAITKWTLKKASTGVWTGKPDQDDQPTKDEFVKVRRFLWQRNRIMCLCPFFSMNLITSVKGLRNNSCKAAFLFSALIDCLHVPILLQRLSLRHFISGRRDVITPNYSPNFVLGDPWGIGSGALLLLNGPGYETTTVVERLMLPAFTSLRKRVRFKNLTEGQFWSACTRIMRNETVLKQSWESIVRANKNKKTY